MSQAWLRTAALAVGLLSGIGGLAAETVTVSPGRLAGWALATFGAGSYEFVAGPGTPPAGAGSLRLLGGPSSVNDLAQASTTLHAGTRLADLTVLGYRLWMTAHPNNPNYAGVFGIAVDHDGVGASTDEILVFEPIWNGYAQETGVWQTWDVLGATTLWSFVGGGPPPEGETFTMAEYLGDHPDAEIVSFGFSIGGGPPSIESSDGSFDRVEIATGGETTTYDFESSLVFEDGFESGDVSAWSASAP